MLPTAHYFSGLIIFSAFAYLELVPHTLLYFLTISFFAIAVDGDIIVFRKHRERMTHTPFFWLLVCGILTLIFPFMWVAIPTALVHLALDSLDWGVMLWWPLSKRPRGPMILSREVGEKKLSTLEYLQVYLHSRLFMTLETAMAAAALILASITI